MRPSRERAALLVEHVLLCCISGAFSRREPPAPLPRIPDWSTLDAAARQRLQAAARPRARALEPALNAFVRIEPMPSPRSFDRPRGGLPYAAKDMLGTPSH